MARVLIVDDSPSQLLGLQRIVEKLGHQVVTAEDGAAGVEAARRELPDLILMDVVMPNLNGFQATRQISKDPATSHIPVILVTTKDQETDKVWGMRQGAKAYVTKPVNAAELVAKVRALLGEMAGGTLFLPPRPLAKAIGMKLSPDALGTVIHHLQAYWRYGNEVLSGFLDAGAARDRLSYRSLRTLADLDPAVLEVTGYTRYRIDGRVETGEATSVVVDRGGIERDDDVLAVRAAIPDFVGKVFAVDGRQLLTQRSDEVGAHGHYSESMERVKDGLPESTVRAAANCCCKAGGQFVKRDSETDNLMSR